MINIADFIFVTADSISMVSDALSTGKPTYVIPIKKVKMKIKKFHLYLQNRKFTQVYKNKLQSWNYKRFEESKKVGNKKKILIFNFSIYCVPISIVLDIFYPIFNISIQKEEFFFQFLSFLLFSCVIGRNILF